MGLKDVLSKMKLVEFEPETTTLGDPPAPSGGPLPGGGPLSPPPGVRPTSPPAAGGTSQILSDLLGELPEPAKIDEKKLEVEAESEGDDIPDFAAVYRAAGVADPSHGYTAYKVLEIFASPGFAALDLRAKASALAGFLIMNPSGPVPITDIVQDAVRRDQALDKFEEFLRAKLAARAAQVDKENADLQKEIDELARRNRDRIEANRIALETEQAKLTRWQLGKRAEELRLFDAVNPFVEANPITTSETPRSAAPAPEPAK